MSHTSFFILFLSLICLASNSTKGRELIGMAELPYSPPIKKSITEDKHFCVSNVYSFERKSKEGKVESLQDLSFSIAGLHPKSCKIALKTLSRYEKFEKLVSVISKSRYNDAARHVYMYVSSFIPPIKMTLNIVIDRLTKPGVYEFTFTTGFLKGLDGAIHVSEFNSRCLFYVESDWVGPDTGYADVFLAFFTRALSEISMKKLFDISQK